MNSDSVGSPLMVFTRRVSTMIVDDPIYMDDVFVERFHANVFAQQLRHIAF
jgi:hypothetical protein